MAYKLIIGGYHSLRLYDALHLASALAVHMRLMSAGLLSLIWLPMTSRSMLHWSRVCRSTSHYPR
ncbi:MAG: hypothetical protein NZ699_15710 [Roseiflexus sp.]|nr:hypothetical protein [Roseiflexus sp.]